MTNQPQTINLTAGHTYVLSCKDPYVEGTSGIQSVTQEQNVLTVENLSPFDFADLGAGTDTGDAKVIVNTPEGVWNAKGTIPSTLSLTEDTGFYWLDDGVREPPFIVGVTIDEGNQIVQYSETLSTGQGTYTNQAYGATPMSGADSLSMGSWDTEGLSRFITGIKPVSFNGTTWSDLNKTDESTWSSTNGTDCFTEFPFRWLSITKSNNVITVVFADSEEAPDSTFQNYAFLGADGITQRPNFHLGCYSASGSASAVYSRRASTVLRNIEFNKYWVQASNRGQEYDCLPFHIWTYIQALFVVLYKSTDSQSQHSKGYTDGGGTADTNSGFTYLNDWGMKGTTQDNYSENQFFWIHNIWGNYNQLCASAFVKPGASDIHYILSAMSNSSNWDNSSWNSSSNYALMTSLGTPTGCNGGTQSEYFGHAQGSNGAGFIVSSSDNGMYNDIGWIYLPSQNGHAYFLIVGGRSSNTTCAGLFAVEIYGGSKDTWGECVARLAYRGGHNY